MNALTRVVGLAWVFAIAACGVGAMEEGPGGSASTAIAGDDAALGAVGSGSAAAIPGVWLVWGTPTDGAAYTKGGQAKTEWGDVQSGTSASSYDFSKLVTEMNSWIAVGKPMVVQINAGTKPSWLGTSATPGIVRCGTNADGDIYNYWNKPSSGANPYVTLQVNLISHLYSDLLNTPVPTSVRASAGSYKDWVLLVREQPNAVGTEHFAPKNYTCPTNGQVNTSSADSTYKLDMMAAFDNFRDATGVRVALRSATVNLDPSYLSGSTAEWIFSTGAEPVDVNNAWSNDSSTLVSNVRTGNTSAYWEPWKNSATYTGGTTYPASWIYWLLLSELHHGIRFMSVYGLDLALSTGNSQSPDIDAALTFANKYAAYAEETAANAALTKGAWIALRGYGYGSGNAGMDQPFADYSMYLSQTTTGSIGVPWDGDSGGNVGKQFQNDASRFGRSVRMLSSAQPSMSFVLDPNFKSRLPATATCTLAITHWNGGGGSWHLTYGTKTQAVTNGSGGGWSTATYSTPCSTLSGATSPEIGLKCASSSTCGSNTAFHMIEVQVSGR